MLTYLLEQGINLKDAEDYAGAVASSLIAVIGFGQYHWQSSQFSVSLHPSTCTLGLF